MTKDNIKTCTNCGELLEGGLIYDHFLEKYGDEKKALETAKLYGATKTKGRWGLAIGMYDMELDRTTHYVCPFCDFKW